jgi:hypothetical protein
MYLPGPRPTGQMDTSFIQYTGYAPINSVDDTACKLGEGGEATYALYVQYV